MSLTASRGRLAALARELSGKWHETKGCWRDAKSEEFERVYLQNLAAQMDKTITTIDKLEQLLTKVRKDCE